MDGADSQLPPSPEGEVEKATDTGAELPEDGHVVARLDRLGAVLEAVRQEMAATHERAAARERVIDRLHDDNQRLRAGERQLLLRPLLADLQRLRNDLLRQAGGLPPDMPASQVAALLESFACSVELTLGRCGVEVVRPEVGTPFDPSRQRAAGVVAAPVPELDGTVVEVLSDGYLDTTADRALAVAAVRVHRWSPPEADSGRPPESPSPLGGQPAPSTDPTPSETAAFAD